MTKQLLSPLEAYRQDLELRAETENKAREDKELKDKEYVTQHSAKRLVQTSPPYPSLVEALEACQANRQDKLCDYAYVTEDNRVVGIYDYYDVTPDQPVMRGQRRVIIPANF
jgi:beta-phosphoglucomutase-like phosphatase (HAD superfamily)